MNTHYLTQKENKFAFELVFFRVCVFLLLACLLLLITLLSCLHCGLWRWPLNINLAFCLLTTPPVSHLLFSACALTAVRFLSFNFSGYWRVSHTFPCPWLRFFMTFPILALLFVAPTGTPMNAWTEAYVWFFFLWVLILSAYSFAQTATTDYDRLGGLSKSVSPGRGNPGAKYL